MLAGKKVHDLTELLGVFEAQEGIVEHIIGATGQGKTYEGTRRALSYLYSGYTVYTTWHLNLPDYYDQREHIGDVIKNLLLFRRHFFRFDLKNNWHHIDIDRPDLVKFIAGLTDCIVFLDEGQDIFDSHDKATKEARRTITRTRHMHKTLIIVSQRAQAVDVNARANVTHFYRCEKKSLPFLPTFFKVYWTEDVDDSNNYPIWVRHDSTGKETWHAPTYHSAFARRWVYNAYDSWYLRQNMIRSQDITVEAFDLGILDRIALLLYPIANAWRNRKATTPKKGEKSALIAAQPAQILIPQTRAVLIPSTLSAPLISGEIAQKPPISTELSTHKLKKARVKVQ